MVVIAHGSRRAAANEFHHQFCAQLGEQLGLPVRAAFLELAEPTIDTALADAADPGGTVLVVPHFLAPGNHTSVDIPTQVAAAAEASPDTTFTMTDFTGTLPGVAAAVGAAVTSAVAESGAASSGH